jgi:hypothetical protein
MEWSGAKIQSSSGVSAGGKVESGEAYPLTGPRDSGEEIVFLRTQGRVCRGAGSDDPSYFSSHEFFCQTRIFYLLADGDFESFTDQLRDIAFSGVMGYAAHRDGDALFFVARSERDLELLRGEDGVVEEKLVEISQAEEQQGAGMLLFDGGILPHQRGGRLGHFNGVRARIITKAGVISG